ncbi:MAG: hypothetical protein AMXMBFR64_42250 [Myxococcales bacterium]
MTEFLAAILAFPTVVFTILLGVVVIYWGFVVLGALDMDFLDVHLDGADGALDGAAEAALGGVDGAAHAAGHGSLDALDGVDGLDGAADGAAEGLHEAAGHGHEGVASLFSALGLRGVPLTVSLSFVVLLAWLSSVVVMEALGGLGDSALMRLIVGAGVTIASLGVGLAGARLAIKPLRRFFVTHAGPESRSLIGEVCVISTSRVDDHFGQAEVADGGAGLLVQVRSADKAKQLGRGERALIIDYDPAHGIFHVVPYDQLLGDGDIPVDTRP